MSTRALLLFFASTSLAISAPVTETFYEWLAPDKTVLCSSKVPGSCDPYAGDATGEEEFLANASSTFELSPSRFFGLTQLFIDVDVSPVTENTLRLRHTFEDAIDLGWYAFEGGTGDFLLEYTGAREREMAGHADSISISVSSPFPVPFSSGGDTIRQETFGRPFRLRGHHKVSVDLLLGPLFSCCFEVITVKDLSEPRFGFDLQGNPLDFIPQLVPVPIPEPGSLTVLGLSAIVVAAIRRRL